MRRRDKCCPTIKLSCRLLPRGARLGWSLFPGYKLSHFHGVIGSTSKFSSHTHNVWLSCSGTLPGHCLGRQGTSTAAPLPTFLGVPPTRSNSCFRCKVTCRDQDAAPMLTTSNLISDSDVLHKLRFPLFDLSFVADKVDLTPLNPAC
ncbi:hypothetical protein M404DRAFT_995455 [Pisolithus tinctorius Marx 270]|uniref:Uncharacterized protein n=1 Tax=Pisolithus tinctorius Marx 270 TaxID=870435 RepID=A0A0C3PN57_PISTI|nr:hypothetical protein M404DRAFT_995455 [Pisolithus tinctorius Marx 270]